MHVAVSKKEVEYNECSTALVLIMGSKDEKSGHNRWAWACFDA